MSKVGDWTTGDVFRWCVETLDAASEKDLDRIANANQTWVMATMYLLDRLAEPGFPGAESAWDFLVSYRARRQLAAAREGERGRQGD